MNGSQSPDFLQALLESSNDAIVGVSLDGVVVAWNRGAEKLYGIAADQVLGKSASAVASLIVPAERQHETSVLLSRVAKGERIEHFETERRTGDGRAIDVSITVVPVVDGQGTMLGYCATVRDITREKLQRRRLETRNSVMRALAEESDLRVCAPKTLEAVCRGMGWQVGELWGLDPEAGAMTHVHTWHEGTPALARFAEATLTVRFERTVGIPGRVWEERTSIWIPDIAADSSFVRRDAAREAGLHAACAVPLVAGDEALGVMMLFSRDVRPRDGEHLATVGSLGTSIGLFLERHRVTSKLARDEARLRAVIETAVDGIITIDADGRIQSFNRSAERLFGYTAGEVLGQNVGMLMPSPHREEHDGYVRRYLAGGAPRVIGIGREVEARRRDGSTFPVHLSISEMRIDGRRMFTGIVSDLTQLRQMQEEVVRSRSLAAIGETAAAIAHELKNPLAALSGPLQIMRNELAEGEPRRGLYEEMLRQVRRLDDIVRQLLLLARPWEPKKEKRDLLATVRRVVRGVEGQPSFTQVRVALDDGTPVEAPVDDALFEQVLLNLLLNSAQAMRAGGEIRIEANVADRTARVRVTDTGPGIPAEVAPKLFRPFFTTKKDGTGLGLSICRKIMEAHGGSLAIESRQGEGTTVTLEFPRN